MAQGEPESENATYAAAMKWAHGPGGQPMYELPRDDYWRQRIRQLENYCARLQAENDRLFYDAAAILRAPIVIAAPVALKPTPCPKCRFSWRSRFCSRCGSPRPPTLMQRLSAAVRSILRGRKPAVR